MYFGPLGNVSRGPKGLRKTQNELLALFAAKHEVQHSGKVRIGIVKNPKNGSKKMYQ
jgi:hypothetical protein